MFRKTGPESALAMFEAEAAGLAELHKAGEIRVPRVIEFGIADGQSFIHLEKLPLERPDGDTARALGAQLAALHRHTASQFGWYRDNTIGLTPQHNEQSTDWTGFFREQRLCYQLELAARNGFGGELQTLGTQIAQSLDALFTEYEPVPSLLHGDLWGGNWGSVAGEPVIFDPAVYYGDRETDLAMTRLFGGFGASFYVAYEAGWPLAPGNQNRLYLYQLYHVLNHVNLFGGSYVDQALRLMRKLTHVV